MKTTVTYLKPINDDLVGYEPILKHFPVEVTRHRLLEWARLGKFPKPLRAVNQKSIPLWRRSAVAEFVREKFWLSNPAAVLAFEAAIDPPRKKPKA